MLQLNGQFFFKPNLVDRLLVEAVRSPTGTLRSTQVSLGHRRREHRGIMFYTWSASESTALRYFTVSIQGKLCYRPPLRRMDLTTRGHNFCQTNPCHRYASQGILCAVIICSPRETDMRSLIFIDSGDCISFLLRPRLLARATGYQSGMMRTRMTGTLHMIQSQFSLSLSVLRRRVGCQDSWKG